MKNIEKIMLCLLMAGSIFTTQALAKDSGYPDEQLIERVSSLEDRTKDAWTDRITLSGILEAEAGYEKTDYSGEDADDETASDLVLATASIGIDAQIADHVSGHAVLLWEEDDTEPVDLDEGYILVEGGESTPFYLKAGKIYVPFGRFESNMISDPLTLELGETRATAFETGFSSGGFYGAIYAFNGDIDMEGDDNAIDNFGVTAGFVYANDNMSLDFGGGWIRDILDTDGFVGLVEDVYSEGEEMGIYCWPRKSLPGIYAHAVMNAGHVFLTGEYLAMLDDHEWDLSSNIPGILDFYGLSDTWTGKAIKAFNIEAGYNLELVGRYAVFGVAYQGVDHGEELYPESRYLGTLRVGLTDNASVALEYRHDEYETDDKADAVTMQFAFEF